MQADLLGAAWGTVRGGDKCFPPTNQRILVWAIHPEGGVFWPARIVWPEECGAKDVAPDVKLAYRVFWLGGFPVPPRKKDEGFVGGHRLHTAIIEREGIYVFEGATAADTLTRVAQLTAAHAAAKGKGIKQSESAWLRLNWPKLQVAIRHADVVRSYVMSKEARRSAKRVMQNANKAECTAGRVWWGAAKAAARAEDAAAMAAQAEDDGGAVMITYDYKCTHDIYADEWRSRVKSLTPYIGKGKGDASSLMFLKVGDSVLYQRSHLHGYVLNDQTRNRSAMVGATIHQMVTAAKPTKLPGGITGYLVTGMDVGHPRLLDPKYIIAHGTPLSRIEEVDGRCLVTHGARLGENTYCLEKISCSAFLAHAGKDGSLFF